MQLSVRLRLRGVVLGWLLAGGAVIALAPGARADDDRPPPPPPALRVIAVEPADQAGSVPPGRSLAVYLRPGQPDSEVATDQLAEGHYGLRLQGGGATTWFLPAEMGGDLPPAPPDVVLSNQVTYSAADAVLRANPGTLATGTSYTATLAVGATLAPLLSADLGLSGSIDLGELPSIPAYSWSFTTATSAVVHSVSVAGLNPVLSLPVVGGAPPTTVTATGGTGSISLATYTTNPAPLPPAGATAGTTYFDVYLGAQSTFTSITISRCGAVAGTQLDWWNGSAWLAASNQTFDPASGCVNLLVTSTTSPALKDLTGTPLSMLLPPPAISALSPSTGPLSGGTAISITGSGFFAPVTATVAGAAAAVRVTSPTSLVVTAPPGPWTGPARVTVTTTGGTAVSPTSFVYQGLSLPLDSVHRVGVPAYFAPGPDWQRFDSAGASAGLAVINPASGPGSSASPAYQTQVAASTARGKAIFGYVPTWYANTATAQTAPGGSLAAVEAEVDRYYRFYGANGLAGIFFDQVTTSCADAGGYYAQLKAYVWNTYRGQVILNPGASVPECFMTAADVVVTFEGYYGTGAGNYLNGYTAPVWMANYPASRFWQIVHDTPATSMPAALELARRRRAGWIYATPLSEPNPYGALPTDPYWSNEVTGAPGVQLNAQTAGAIGNGIADDTTALVHAIGTLTPTGGTLTLPAGTYRVRASGYLGVPAGVTLSSSAGATIKAAEYGFNELSINGSAAAIEGVTVEGAGMVVRGLTIGSGSSQAIVQDSVVRDVAQPTDPTVLGYAANYQQTAAGIRVEGGLDHVTVARTTVRNVHSYHNDPTWPHPVARGLWITPASSMEHVASNVTVDSSSFSEIGPKDDGDCLVIQSGSQDVGFQAGLRVTNNQFDFCHKRAVKIQVEGAVVSGNHVDNPFLNNNWWTTYPATADNFDMYSAISALASNVSITGNVISGVGSFYNGIEADANGPLSNITVSNNAVTMGSNSRIGAPSSLVRTLVTVSGLTITGNTLTHAQVGINLSQPATPGTVIANNVIRDVPIPYQCAGGCPGSTLALSASPSSVSTAGGTTNVQLAIARGPALTAPVTLGVAGTPPGMAAAVAPTPTGGNAATLTVGVNGAAAGSHTLTITATSGGTSSDLKFIVNVQPRPPAPTPSGSPTPPAWSAPPSHTGPPAPPVAPPQVTSIAPTTGPVTGGTSISVVGTGFYSPLSASIGGIAARATVLSSTQLTLVSPPQTSPGPAAVVITTRGGRSKGGPTFTYR
ncbi:MAG: hypothetical protein NVSMB29_10970 [Candidatus Dormibacteria bacterium]